MLLISVFTPKVSSPLDKGVPRTTRPFFDPVSPATVAPET